MVFCLRVAMAVAVAAVAQTSAALTPIHGDPPASCTAELDAFCGNPSYWATGAECYASIHKANGSEPLFAARSGGKNGISADWRCYSPTALTADPRVTPLLSRVYNTQLNSPDYCSVGDALSSLYYKPPCTAGDTNPVVFPSGHIPSLVYAPPNAPGADPTNGTLIAFMQPLMSARSTDHGATWTTSVPPIPESPGPASVWCCPQSLYDPASQSVVLQFGNATHEKGGCDIGVEQLGGIKQIRSVDGGKTWGPILNVQAQLEGVPTGCLSPTSGGGVVMRPVNGKYGGRLVFCAVRNAYEGDIPVFSDDGGKTYSFSTGVYKAGLDECSIAQATNGSLVMIARNCEESNLTHCQMVPAARESAMKSAEALRGPGNHRFAVSVSNDGGETWGPIGYQQQLVTPVCQGMITSYKGPLDSAPALYFSGPNSDTERTNGVIRASDDNGVTYSRLLDLGIPTYFGYTSVVCGLVGAPSSQDCGVLYDAGGVIRFVRFRSADVK
eukprot:m.465594 g.465594  ORF g.465594 m.465594 type:complete len:498 (-) comp24344_c0_seq1:92-1585(-)